MQLSVRANLSTMIIILSIGKKFRAVSNSDSLKEYKVIRRVSEKAVGWIRLRVGANSRWMFDSMESPLSITDLLELSNLMTKIKERYQRSVLGDDYIED